MIKDEETGWTEPEITINGTTLSFGQAMTLRVAVGNFLIQVQDPDGLGDDEAGRSIAKGYKARLGEIAQLMHKHGDK